MPPKRGRGGARGGSRATSRASATPGPSEVSRDASPFDPTRRAQRTPGPPRFSSSYGSPVVLTSRRIFTGGSAAGAIDAALRTVQDANDVDSRTRDAPESEEDEAYVPGGDEDEDAVAMPPPPLPRQRAGRGGRSASAAPASDAISQRSFVEESQLYGSADVGTPRSAERPQKSPIRSSARIARRESVAREDSAPPTPSPSRPPARAVSRSRNPPPPPVSDSIDEEDEEDPLANPTPRGVRRIDRAASVPQQSTRRPDRPNPVQDVRSGSVALPRPDRNTPQPLAAIASGNDFRPTLPANGAPKQPISRGTSNNQVARQNERPAQRPTERPAVPPNSASPPVNGPSQGSSDESLDDEEEEEEESLISAVMNAFLDLFRVNSWPQWLRNALQILAMLTFLCWFWLFLLELFLPLDRWEGVRAGKNYTLYGVNFWRQNIAQIVPWIVLHPLAVLTGNLNYADFRNTLHWLEVNSQHNKIRMDFLTATTHQMRRVLPELIAVKVDRISDQWTVEDSFWHAMDEQMKQGNLMYSLLTLEKTDDGSYAVSDPHWSAIRQRIENDGTLISDRPAVGDGSTTLSDQIITYVDQSVAQAWADWLKDNEKAIKRVDRDKTGDPNPLLQDLYGDVEKAVSKRLHDLGLEEQIITRDEFIEEIKHQSNQYATQIRTEMDSIQGRLDRALEIAEEVKKTTQTPPGMSRVEVKAMIDEAVQRSIVDAQLEAIAKGNIKSHLNTDLLRKKDYFSTIRGAIIDPDLTSTSYGYSDQVTPKHGAPRTRPWPLSLWKTDKKEVFREGGKHSTIEPTPGMALERWNEDGECWCAGLGDVEGDSAAASLSIMTVDTVVPQHLVVEHIASTGTFDPGAMPRDMEVWIRAPTDKRRRTLEHWSAQRWPDARRSSGGGGGGASLPARGFVKVGEFRYDNAVAKGESQVFRLSEDLVRYDAQTRQVLVRAKTNYGAEDHTCFYRLRLFGEEGRGQDRGALE